MVPGTLAASDRFRPAEDPCVLVIDRLTAVLRRVRMRQWDLDGGPGPVLRLAVRAPLATTASLAVALAAVFAAVFGVPPVSPLVLVVLVVAPLYPWLRAERRLYHAWRTSDRPQAGRADEQEAGERRDEW